MWLICCCENFLYVVFVLSKIIALLKAEVACLNSGNCSLGTDTMDKLIGQS